METGRTIDVSITLQHLARGRNAGMVFRMIGSSGAVFDRTQVTVPFKARAKNAIKAFRISLDCMDLYKVEYLTKGGKVVKTDEQVYCDALPKTIEQTTGLYLSL